MVAEAVTVIVEATRLEEEEGEDEDPCTYPVEGIEEKEKRKVGASLAFRGRVEKASKEVMDAISMLQ